MHAFCNPHRKKHFSCCLFVCVDKILNHYFSYDHTVDSICQQYNAKCLVAVFPDRFGALSTVEKQLFYFMWEMAENSVLRPLNV